MMRDRGLEVAGVAGLGGYGVRDRIEVVALVERVVLPPVGAQEPGTGGEVERRAAVEKRAPVRNVPAGITTLHRGVLPSSIAFWIARVLSVVPSPTAPSCGSVTTDRWDGRSMRWVMVALGADSVPSE